MTQLTDRVVQPTPAVKAPEPLTAVRPYTGAAPQSSVQYRMRRAMVAIFLVEAAAVMCVGAVAWEVRNVVAPVFGDVTPPVSGGNHIDVSVQFTLVVLLWLSALVVAGAYSAKEFAVGYGDFPAITRASLFTMGLIGFGAYALQLDLSRGLLLLNFGLGVPVLLGMRYAERKAVGRLRAHGRLRHRAVLVGSTLAVQDLMRVLSREAWTGYEVLGVCASGETAPWFAAAEVSVLGGVGDVAQIVRTHRADTVIVAGGTYSSSRDLRRVGWQLEGQNVELLVAPSLTDVAGPRIRVRNVAGLPLMHVQEAQLTRARGPLKGAFDRLVALCLLVAAAPVMLTIAVAVKLQDRGPVFFRQERVGAMDKRFRMVKFRTMCVDAEQRLEALRASSHDGNDLLFKMRQDPRVTRVGGWLRRLSLDELPQLFNVLRGDMSLVGPRPALPAEVEGYEDDARRRLLVRPGMTGLWQVSGRSDLSWEDSVRLDLYYVDNWSLMGDLVILAKTARAVLGSSGAY